MNIYLGETGLNETWQEPFSKETKCHSCGGRAEIAFVACENERGKTAKFICQAKETTGERGGLWVHDACAVAVYFCRDCLETTAIMNQA
jgi:hypothetical protein